MRQYRTVSIEFWLARRFGRIWALDYRSPGLILALARMGYQSIYWGFSDLIGRFGADAPAEEFLRCE